MKGAKKKGPARKRATKKMRVGGMAMMPTKKMSGGGRPGAKKKGPVRRKR